MATDAEKKLERVRALIARTASNHEEEARTSATIACRIIREEKMTVAPAGATPDRGELLRLNMTIASLTNQIKTYQAGNQVMTQKITDQRAEIQRLNDLLTALSSTTGAADAQTATKGNFAAEDARWSGIGEILRNLDNTRDPAQHLRDAIAHAGKKGRQY